MHWDTTKSTTFLSVDWLMGSNQVNEMLQGEQAQPTGSCWLTAVLVSTSTLLIFPVFVFYQWVRAMPVAAARCCRSSLPWNGLALFLSAPQRILSSALSEFHIASPWAPIMVCRDWLGILWCCSTRTLCRKHLDTEDRLWGLVLCLWVLEQCEM